MQYGLPQSMNLPKRPCGASTQGIAHRAGLTKPQLHYYISSKEELYEDIIVYILEEWEDIFLGASTEDDPAKVIRQYIRAKLEYSQKSPKASRLFTTEIANGAPYLSRHWKSTSQRPIMQ